MYKSVYCALPCHQYLFALSPVFYIHIALWFHFTSTCNRRYEYQTLENSRGKTVSARITSGLHDILISASRTHGDVHPARFSIFREYVVATNCANICNSPPLSTNSVSSASRRGPPIAVAFVQRSSGEIINFHYDTPKYQL